ncbi:hypothetical protein ACWGI0_18255 [Streptomyces sp. NPDC054802]
MNQDAMRRMAERARELEAEIGQVARGDVPDHVRAAIDLAGEEAGKSARLAESALSGDSSVAMANSAADKFVLASEQMAEILAALGTSRTEPARKLPLADRAGAVIEHRAHGDHTASPELTAQTPYYFPGGLVFNVLVPRGFYSEPWWRDIGLLTAAGSVTGVYVGELASDFYAKVLAQRDGRPSVTEWADGVEATAGGAHRWWESLEDLGVLEWLV